jgi:hypothetical protein
LPALAHIVMHITLCSAMAHAPAGTPMHLSMRAQDHTGRLTFNRDFTVTRGESDSETIEFDAPYGTYRAVIAAPQFHCSLGDYLVFRPPHERNMKETLLDGPPRWPKPTILFGATPQSFLSAQPTFVLLDARTKCNQPVSTTIPGDIHVEYDPDSFFVTMFNTGAPRDSQLLALQIQTATGDDQYVSLKTTFPFPWQGWPVTYEFNLKDDMFDALATMPKNVLLCPKLYKTSSG